MSEEKHCETCICGRRAPVQAESGASYPPGSPYHRPGAKGPGTVSWAEHLEAYSTYAAQHGQDQSAERLAARGGFAYREITDLLGHEPKTWRPTR
jgi:hypothetical protein